MQGPTGSSGVQRRPNRGHSSGPSRPQITSPQRQAVGFAAGAAVRAHEQQHVSNAYKKASQNNGKVLACNVTLKTAVCPECGRSYVAGGVTSTQIKYYNEENPYQKDLKSSDRAKYLGNNIDLAG